MPKALNLVGERYGMLTVIKRVGNSSNGHSNWLCQCDCGNFTTVHSGHLREKRGTKSCGCLWKKAGERTYKHGGTGMRLYAIWDSMNQRCRNQNHPSFSRYGGRGISICDEWLDFENFRQWAYANGYDENAKRGECTIDRIDNDGNYEPSNCRWTTAKEQARNTSKCGLFIKYEGKNVMLSKVCEELGINYGRVRARMRRGKTFEEAIINLDKDLRGKYERKRKDDILSAVR